MESISDETKSNDKDTNATTVASDKRNNWWKNLDSDIGQCKKNWCRMETKACFKNADIHIRAHCIINAINLEDYHFWRNFRFYKELRWLPTKMSPSNCATTKKRLDRWKGEIKLMNEDWNLKKNAYIRRDGDIIHIECVYTRSWFGNRGMNVPNKVYFWRTWFCNTDRGREKIDKYGKLMIDRLNLCYCAWAHIMSIKPDYLPAAMIPLVTFTEKRYKNNEFKDRLFERPQWTFVYDKNDIRNNNIAKEEVIPPLHSLGSVVDTITGLRKSARIAQKLQD